ncbi:hypothetical protein DZF91_25865 [Actinomadura logoneensis]|uniref:DUF3618 domain-containing protein n=2 Tax=Actinomadura logoneensis TaxID=2293572 RepID=A0A372JFZ9_9ACTN|nr:hypothetical protein DZF91_25865 [Actinomadura logoneensis]
MAGSGLGRTQTAMRQGLSAARDGASAAKERMGPAAQQSREMAAARMLALRGWSAPVLRQAAKYVETDLSPKMSSMLAQTADRVEPPRPARRGRKAVVALLAGVTAAGVAGAVLTRRNAAQEAEMMSDESTSDKADSESADDQVRSHSG